MFIPEHSVAETSGAGICIHIQNSPFSCLIAYSWTVFLGILQNTSVLGVPVFFSRKSGRQMISKQDIFFSPQCHSNTRGADLNACFL